MGKYSNKPASVSPNSVGTSELIDGWDDNLQTFSSARGAGTAEPVWANIGNGNYAMRFTAGDELFVSHHVGHDYKQGTDAYMHIHFLCDQTQTVGATVVWRYSYELAKGHTQGESLTDARTVIDMTYTYLGTEIAGEHIIVECSDLQAFDLREPDTMIMGGVELLSETVAGNIYGVMSDLHYQTDRRATVNKEPNFYGA